MGRLRSGKDAEYFCRVAAEVTELYGTSDAILYRYFGKEDENLTGKDPIWDEPTTTAFFESYPLPIQWFDYASISNASEHGRDQEIDATAYITVTHLVAASVPLDPDKEYVAAGDTLAIHTDCGNERIEYDIIQINRDGWVDSSDVFVGYSIELKRRDKYVPERKTS
jgi:hypothetical protein